MLFLNSSSFYRHLTMAAAAIFLSALAVQASAATGTITIVKVAQPHHPQDFLFTHNVASSPSFYLDDDPSDNTRLNSKTFTLPAGASYTFTEAMVSGWNLTSIVCAPSNGATANIPMRAATIALTAGANVTCTFTNVKPPTGQITIVKVAQPNDAQAFNFTPSVATFPSFHLDDDPSNNTFSNSRTFANLPTGSTTTFTEGLVAGWNLASIVCSPSTGTTTSVPMRSATITMPAGANVTCTFTNVKLPTGQITIVKVAQPNHPQAFRFTPSVAGIPSFDLDDDPSNNTLSNSKTFSNLLAGSSTTFTETQVPGWSLASIVCSPSAGTTTSPTGSATIVMTAGAHVTCTFTNVKLSGDSK